MGEPALEPEHALPLVFLSEERRNRLIAFPDDDPGLEPMGFELFGRHGHDLVRNEARDTSAVAAESDDGEPTAGALARVRTRRGQRDREGMVETAQKIERAAIEGGRGQAARFEAALERVRIARRLRERGNRTAEATQHDFVGLGERRVRGAALEELGKKPGRECGLGRLRLFRSELRAEGVLGPHGRRWIDELFAHRARQIADQLHHVRRLASADATRESLAIRSVGTDGDEIPRGLWRGRGGRTRRGEGPDRRQRAGPCLRRGLAIGLRLRECRDHGMGETRAADLKSGEERTTDQQSRKHDEHPGPKERGDAALGLAPEPPLARQSRIWNLSRGLSNQAGTDLRGAGRVASEQRAIAKLIHEARDAACAAVHLLEGGFAEEVLRFTGGDGQAMTHVGARLVGAQRIELPAYADPLTELTQAALVELAIEFGLTEQQDLDQLVATGLEIREESNLFERVLGEGLRFIDDQQDALVRSFLFDEEGVELVHQRAAPEAFCGQVELGADRLKEFEGGSARVEEKGELGVAVEPLEQGAAERRLASAHFARDRDEPLPLLDSVQKMSKGLPVGTGEVEESGIRAQHEGFFTQAIERGIHGLKFRGRILTH